MRRERTLLQHEVDILNQKLTQELLSLKDDLKGMFDDRKMAVRQEQRAMESAVSSSSKQNNPRNPKPNVKTDPRTQLQNHRVIKQRQQIRSRRSSLDPDKKIRDWHLGHGFHGLDLVTICELQVS